MAQVRRKRTRSYAATKKRLDAIFSQWTRFRFADASGNVACVCCGAVKNWKELQCSHFVSRSYLATRWLAENCSPACFQCNVLKSGNLAAYAAWGVDRYGMDWPARMVSLSRQPTKYSRSDLEALIAEYEEKLKVLTG